jgi:hypothetical protein
MKLIISLIALLFMTACDEAQNTPPSAPVNTPVVQKPNVPVKAVRNSAACAIDLPKKAALVSAKESLRISGWAYDAETMTSPASVQVKLVSVNGLSTKILDATRFKRPDLVESTKKSGVEMAGVDLTIPANTLVPGKYDVVILQDGPNYTVQCAKDYNFEVVEKLTPVQAPVVDSSGVQAPTTATKPEVTPAVTKKKTKKAKNIDE